MFFSAKPNLPDSEKARIEFHLQQLADCIGMERFQRPVVSTDSLLHQFSNSAQDLIGFVGQHLSHDVSELKIEFVPEQVEKCLSLIHI